MKKLLYLILFIPVLSFSQNYIGYSDADSIYFGNNGTTQTTAFTTDTVNQLINDTVTTMINDTADVLRTEIDDTASNLRTDLMRKDAVKDSVHAINQDSVITDTLYSTVITAGGVITDSLTLGDSTVNEITTGDTLATKEYLATELAGKADLADTTIWNISGDSAYLKSAYNEIGVDTINGGMGLFSDKIGIGKIPVYSLDINSSRMRLAPSPAVYYAVIQFDNGGGNYYLGPDNSTGSFLGSAASYAYTMVSPSPPIVFIVGSERMRINSSGNVGIGSRIPLTTLHAKGSSSSTDPITNPVEIRIDNTNLTAGTMAGFTAGWDSSTTDKMGLYPIMDDKTNGDEYGYWLCQTFKAGAPINSLLLYPDSIGLDIDGTRVMTINSDGNVGIGSHVPLTKLHIETPSSATTIANNGIIVTNSNATVNNFESIGLGMLSTDATKTALIVGVNKNRTGGSEEIGFKFLPLRGGTQYTAWQVYVDSIIGSIGGVEKFRVNSDGKVAIGKSNPRATSLLDVAGNISSTSLHIWQKTNSLSGGLILYDSTAMYASGIFRTYGANGNLIFRNQGINSLYINNGRLGILTTAPDKQLEINSATGAVIRGTYNDADGSAANYFDLSVNATGDMNINASGDTITTSNVINSTDNIVTSADVGCDNLKTNDTIFHGVTNPDTATHAGNKVTHTDTIAAPGFEVGLSTIDITNDDNDLLINGLDTMEVDGIVQGNIFNCIDNEIQLNGVKKILSQGTRNLFLGELTGNKTLSGTDNYIFGYANGLSLTSGTGNILLASSVGANITTGSRNVIIGINSGNSITTGIGNVLIGAYSGQGLVTNDSCIFIGNYAGQNENTSHKLYIENTNSSNPLIYGEFDNDIVRINGNLEADTFRFNIPDTNYYSIHPSKFSSNDPDGNDVSVSSTAIVANGNNIVFIIPVNLPDGATIVNISMKGTISDETYQLNRADFAGSTDAMTSATNINTNITSISYLPIDNSSYSYCIYTSSLDATDAIYGVSIKYTIIDL